MLCLSTHMVFVFFRRPRSCFVVVDSKTTGGVPWIDRKTGRYTLSQSFIRILAAGRGGLSRNEETALVAPSRFFRSFSLSAVWSRRERHVMCKNLSIVLFYVDFSSVFGCFPNHRLDFSSRAAAEFYVFRSMLLISTERTRSKCCLRSSCESLASMVDFVWIA
jgi:hypothetical protein